MSIRTIITTILEENEASRDNDPLLYMLVADQLEINHLPTYALLTELPYQTVRANRQLIQAKNEHLRWNTYTKRQRYSRKKKKEYSLTAIDKLKFWRQSV